MENKPEQTKPKPEAAKHFASFVTAKVFEKAKQTAQEDGSVYDMYEELAKNPNAIVDSGVAREACYGLSEHGRAVLGEHGIGPTWARNQELCAVLYARFYQLEERELPESDDGDTSRREISHNSSLQYYSEADE